ncbi:hypothetical protein C0585_07735 [Candidatus Woesearchaeota archaeon]|nr:MAG: hypothetical protein C0585_07735 [Candidatus Woesearchaeota archaeon]
MRKPIANYKNKPCPKCGSDDINRILYGLYDSEYVSKCLEEGKKVTFGGCLITDNSPAFECNKCGNKFGKTRPF